MAETQALDLDLSAVGSTRVATAAFKHRVESMALGPAVIVLLLIIWELLPYFVPMKQGTRLFFTVPSRILATLWQMFASGSIWAPLGVSATAFAIGLALAIAAGLPLGILLCRSNTLNPMFHPFITAFNPTPRLAFFPLLLCPHVIATAPRL